MGLQLTTIAVFVGLALLYNLALPAKWRGWTLFIISASAIYWLQPAIRVRFLDFALPTATLLLTASCWFLTRQREQRPTRSDAMGLMVLLALIFGLGLLRFAPLDWRFLVASRPPNPLSIFALIVAFALASLVLSRIPQTRKLPLLMLVLVSAFVALKFEPFATQISAFFRANAAQDVSLAASVDLNWLGFSYVAFRLLHTVRDRQTGVLPALNLRDYVTYVIFFPAFIAGPIDRAEKFQQKLGDLVNIPRFDAERFTVGFGRIAVGISKKFIIADTLALGMALNPQLAGQSSDTASMWLLLYGYALRLFFDFSGYTDIVIGIGILFGITLPENFKQPYTRTNITQFWQSWHITLSDWARFYVFSPLTRTLLRRKPRPSPALVVLLTQLATMIVIGLWHGITVNFFIWGVWHGIALFVHKQVSDRTRKWYRELKAQPARKRAWDALFWFITFHYVVLGWVWFALPDVEQALRVFGVLSGVAS